MHQKLYDALRTGDHQAAIKARYSITEEGEIVRIEGQNFSDADLHRLPGHFILFENCVLDNADFSDANFFPVAFKNCSMKKVNISRIWGMMEAWDCDLRGARYEGSQFNPKSHTDSPSSFEACLLDVPFKKYLEAQGCAFTISQSSKRINFLQKVSP